MRVRNSLSIPPWRAFAVGLALPLMALPAQVLAAQVLPVTLPEAAQMIGDRAEALGSHPLPTGPWQNGAIPAKQTEGALRQSAWRLPLDGRNTLQLLAPLRAQIAAAGFVPVYECETLACGGFDFRFGTDILPEPQMHVDLGDFRYFAAERPGALGPEYISLIVSRSAMQGFVQVTQIGPASAPEPDVTASTKSEPIADLPTAFALQAGVAQVLADLNFAPGKADLLGDAPAVAALRDWLTANPQAQIDLIGHSDSSGDPTRNTALSLARAESVRDRLVAAGIAAERIVARGLGPAEPVADNITPEGRQKNRRVEVMLTSTR